jgi:hypothetical protein
MTGRVSPLTKQDLKLIRAAKVERDRLKVEAMKLSNTALAKKFGVSATAISDVLTYKYSYINSRNEQHE